VFIITVNVNVILDRSCDGIVLSTVHGGRRDTAPQCRATAAKWKCRSRRYDSL